MSGILHFEIRGAVRMYSQVATNSVLGIVSWLVFGYESFQVEEGDPSTNRASERAADMG